MTKELQMRICLATPSASRLAYGIFPIVVGTSRALTERGHDVQVIAGNDAFTATDGAAWGAVPVKTFRLPPPRALNYMIGLEHWLKSQSPFDVISLQGVWMASHATAQRAAAKAGVPTMLTPQGSLDAWALKLSSAKKRLARLIYADAVLRGVNCFHVNSESEAQAVRNLGLMAPISIIPNGVATPKRINRADSEKQSRSLLFLGRLHTKKGIRELVEAWTAVSHEAPTWKLIVAGPDELGLRQELERIARGTRVEFTGPVFDKDKDALLRSADAFILPSFSEGFPMAVLEAWAFELPVLMTRECNIEAGFTQQAAVELRPSTESIAEAIRRITQMPYRELAGYGTRGRELVDRCYSWQHVADQLVGVYEWLCGRAPQPASIQLA